MDHELGEQWVVFDAHDGSPFEAGVHAHPRACRLDPLLERSGARQEIDRILRIETHLDRMTTGSEPFRAPRHRQRRATRDLELPPDEIEPERRLRDRVLHLEPRVHLEKIEPALGVEQELDRPGANVFHGSRRRDCRLSHSPAQRRVERRARSLLDDLLVPPLDAAFALEEMDRVAVPVREDLELDVPGSSEELLQVNPVVSERGRGDPTPLRESARQLRRGLDPRHALAAPARGRLDQDRKPDLLRGAGERLVVAGVFIRSGDDRHPRRAHAGARPKLVRHLFDRGRRRADPREASLFDGAPELRALGEETVPRMNGVRPGCARGLQDPRDRQVRFGDGTRSQGDGAVGAPGVDRGCVVFRKHRDRLDPHLARRPEHPDRDLAAVGDEDPPEGRTVFAQRRRPRVRAGCCHASFAG